MGKEACFCKSTIGKKMLVAVTGIILFGFVLMHMLGNLKAFAGVEAASGIYKLDLYAEFLREIGAKMLGHGGVLWATRIVLLLAVVAHVVTVIQLRMLSRKARPEKYEVEVRNASTLASRTMVVGGVFLLIFIVVHILHFTTGHLHFSGFVHGKVYANVTASFQSVAWLVFYAVAMIFLCLHLYHGLWSLFQTLGIDNPEWNPMIRRGAQAFAFIVSLGFISVPLSIFLGVLKEPAVQVSLQTGLGM